MSTKTASKPATKKPAAKKANNLKIVPTAVPVNLQKLAANLLQTKENAEALAQDKKLFSQITEISTGKMPAGFKDEDDVLGAIKLAEAFEAPKPSEEKKPAKENTVSDLRKPREICGVTTTLPMTDKNAQLIEALCGLDEDLQLVEKVNYYTITSKKMARIIFTVERTGKDDRYDLLFNKTDLTRFIPFMEKHFKKSLDVLRAEKIMNKQPEGYYYDGSDFEDATALAKEHLSYTHSK